MKRTKTTGRIYPGEYHLPSDRTAPQREFFGAIQRTTPQVMKSLREELLPEYLRLYEEPRLAKAADCEAMYRLCWDWAAGHRLVAGARLLPVEETCRGLTDAEIQARLVASENSSEMTFFYPWARFAIMATLEAWCVNPPGEALTWRLPHWPYPFKDEADLLTVRTRVPQFSIEDLFTPRQTGSTVPFSFTCPDWNPLQETRTQVKQRVLGEVQKQLERELDRRANLVKLVGAERAEVRQTPEHYDWLALYQVAAKPYDQIGREWKDERFRQSVTDGVEDAAKQVIGDGWERWLRKSKRGRPKTQ